MKFGRFFTSEWIIATYSARIPIINDNKPKKNRTIVTIVAKPANGVPITNLRIAKTTIVPRARPEQTSPNHVINLNGISEKERMPRNYNDPAVVNSLLDAYAYIMHYLFTKQAFKDANFGKIKSDVTNKTEQKI